MHRLNELGINAITKSNKRTRGVSSTGLTGPTTAVSFGACREKFLLG
jgi:hypothetical protein